MPTEHPPTGPLYFDDLKVGLEFSSRSHIIDAAQIMHFAREFDPQPFHIDEDLARHGPFGGLVASGWHTAALTMRLLVDGSVIAGGMIGANVEVTWTKPVRPGDELSVHSRVIETMVSRSRPDRGIVTMRSETRDQRGDVLQVLIARVVVPRDPNIAPA